MVDQSFLLIINHLYMLPFGPIPAFNLAIFKVASAAICIFSCCLNGWPLILILFFSLALFETVLRQRQGLPHRRHGLRRCHLGPGHVRYQSIARWERYLDSIYPDYQLQYKSKRTFSPKVLISEKAVSWSFKIDWISRRKFWRIPKPFLRNFANLVALLLLWPIRI